MKGRDVTSGKFFRPPYGRLRIRQYRILERTMRIVFWDIMPYDFDKKMSPETSYSILSHRARPGSVIVLHDKPESHALVYLDRFIRSSLEKGYTFGSLDDYSMHR